MRHEAEGTGNDVQNLASSDSLRSEAARELSSRLRIVGDKAEMLDSQTDNTLGTKVGETDRNKEMTATVMVRSKASEKELNATLAKIISHEMKPLDSKEFNEKFGADPEAMQRVLDFAKKNGLTVKEAEMDSGKVLLTGKVGNFSDAFSVQFADYKTPDGKIARERLGTISVPRDVGSDIQAVLGLDTRSHEKAMNKETDTKNSLLAPMVRSSFMPNQVADAYNFPKESMGAGQSVGIIELGGGLDLHDNAKYYQSHGLKLPDIQIVSVDGMPNKPGENSNADGEVALDSQVIGAVAPDAHQQIVFAPNDDSGQGFSDGMTRLIFPEDGEQQNSAISISWGGRETDWDQQAIKNVDLEFKKAAIKGISVFCAAGDTGAGDTRADKPDDGKFVADFPASDPWVTASGGTRLEIGADGKPHEVVWNDGDGVHGTGGGISQIFPKPEFQKGLDVPANPSPLKPDGMKDGRAEPDVSGDASPATAYIVRYGGREHVIGGTSAVAPLYSALVMRVNGALGRPVGYLNPFLYKNGHSGIFNDVTEGNNNGYNAGPGWDAATGWGSIRGTEFLSQIGKELKLNPNAESNSALA